MWNRSLKARHVTNPESVERGPVDATSIGERGSAMALPWPASHLDSKTCSAPANSCANHIKSAALAWAADAASVGVALELRTPSTPCAEPTTHMCPHRTKSHKGGSSCELQHQPLRSCRTSCRQAVVRKITRLCSNPPCTLSQSGI